MLHCNKSICEIVFGMLLFIQGCSNKGTEPEELIPGRRDYEWQVDNISEYFPENRYVRMIEDQNTIYLVNSTSVSNLVIRKDSSEITSYYKEYGINAIYSIIKNNNGKAYVLTQEGGFYEYDYVNNFFTKLKSPGMISREYNYVSTKLVNGLNGNVFTNCVRFDENSIAYSTVASYENGIWVQKAPEIANYNCPVFYETQEGIFTIGLSHIEGKYWDKIFHIIGDHCKMVTEQQSFFDNRLYFSLVKDQIFILKNKALFRYSNDTLQKIVELGELQLTSFKFFGRNENDIFFNGERCINHYNGSDIKKIKEFNFAINFHDYLIKEEEVIFTSFDYNTMSSYLITGK